MRICFCLFAVLAFIRGAAADQATVDLQALARVGASTARRLQTSPASWNVSNTLENGAVVQVSVLRGLGHKERMVWSIESNRKRIEFFRLIIRDGMWYVTDQTGPFKYRPYEAPAESVIVYMTMDRAKPLFVSDAGQMAGAKLEGVNANIATFRVALPPAQVAQVKAVVDQMALFSKQTGKPLTAELARQLDLLNDLIIHGIPNRVDLSDGRIVENGTVKLRSKIADFRFLDKVDEREFAVGGRQWNDCSDDPTAGNLDDLIMIGHQPGMQPGAKNYELDGRLMDVKSGRFRRIPFPGAEVMPGCFLKDRRSVIVNGVDGSSGSLRPYRIDLKTGQCDLIGSPILDTGFTLGADLSPDGKTVVVQHMDPGSGILHSQICLIDLASGTAKTLGKPMDAAYLNWTADGRHLILIVRDSTDMSKASIDSIATIDMNGTVNILRRGSAPVLLADRQTILFQSQDTGLWCTCDLNGKDFRPYADGLKGYGFPSPAPDGKRLLFMHFNPGHLPEPVIFPVGASQGQVLTQVEGLWGMPAWR